MAIGVKKWAKVRAYYETGEFSVEKLSKKHKISTPSINTKIHKDNWVKAKLKPLIEKTIQEKYVQALSDRGIDQGKISEVLEEMLGAKYKKDPDWKARDKAITQVAKLTGAYATEKLKLELPDVPSTLEVVVIKSGKKRK